MVRRVAEVFGLSDGTVGQVDSGVAVTPSDVSLGVLVTSVPRAAVDAVVAACDVGAQRSGGTLPPHVAAYLTMGLCLFPDNYSEVATKVTGALDRFGCWSPDWSRPTGSGITQARKRLGAGVMPELFERVCGPVAGEPSRLAGRLALGAARGSFLRGWRLTAIDGFDIDVYDTPENAEEFGYHGSGENRSAFPKMRVVAMSECGTHAFFAARMGPWKVGEQTMARRLYQRLRPDELLTADRNFYSWGDWCRASDTGAALLWRAPTQLILEVVRVCRDGTYLTVLLDPDLSPPRRRKVVENAKAGAELDPTQARLARVVEYDVPDRDGNGTGELIVLLSTVLDPKDASADELAAAYHERWEQETAHDELKTHLHGAGKTLRSRLPDLVYQEMWALLIVHHAITTLKTRASQAADIDPDLISFTETLNVVRRTATGTADIPP